MKLPKDLLTQTYMCPDLFLCETDKATICKLDTTSMEASLKFNTYSELTCTVGRTYMDIMTGRMEINPYYDKIEALRLLYLDGFGYFEIQDPEIVSDGIKEVKNITAHSLEYSLSQKYLEDFYINTGEVNSVEVIYSELNNNPLVPVTFYNVEDPNLSLLHLALEKIYGWTIGHVDESLKKMSRSFEVSRESVYDFLTQDLCEKFNCFIVFDTVNNEINFYAESLSTKYIGDGSTKIFEFSTPYDSISTVTVDSYKTTSYKYEILVDEVTEDKIGRITFDAAPKQGAIIEVTDGSQKQWMTDVYVTFDNLAQEVSIDYSADNIKTVLTVKGADDLDIREVNFGLPYIVDLSYYYNPNWMGQDLYDAYTNYLQVCNLSQSEYTQNAKKMIELDGCIAYETQRLSLQYSIADNVTSTTVGTYYIKGGDEKSGYYYKEVKLPDEYSANTEHYYTLSGTDLDEDKFSKLYQAIQTYFVSESNKDVSEINALKDSFAFMETNTIDVLSSKLSNATNLDAKDTAILNFFDEMWEQLGRTPLNSLYLQPYKKIKETNIEAGWNNTNDENYWKYYPVTLIIKSLEDEIKDRDATIAEYNTEYSSLQKQNNDITNKTSIYNNFSHNQLARLSPFLREDEYIDDNFVETDSDTTEILMKTKEELLECGRIELSKLCSPKLEFSMDMANIFAMTEFEPIIGQFQLGNLINVVIRRDDEQKKGYIKSARLLEVNINFKDFSDFSCVFGELTERKTPSSIHADLLASALSAGKSVASNASYWNKSSEKVTSLELQMTEGLANAVHAVKNNDGTQHISTGHYGIRLQKYDKNGNLNPREGWIVNNQFLYSSDNFKTAESVFGEYTIGEQTYWGLLAKAIMAGYIAGCTIEGGTINIGDGKFVVDAGGNVTMKAASINGYVEEDGIISSINQSPESVTINANKISLAGKAIDLTSDNITIDSTNFSVTKDGKIVATDADISGKITADSGEIGGWTIYDSLLRKEITIDNVEYQMYLQAADGVSTSNAFAVRKRESNTSSWDVQFAVNYAGKMTAKNANITGSITATDGSIAGYNIGSGGSYDNALYKRVAGDGTGVGYEVGLKATSGDTDLAFYVKQSEDDWTSNSNVFYVRNNGQLYAQKADITGKITASSGKIGSWNVGDMGNYTDSLYSTFCAAETPSSSDPEYAVFMRGKGSSSSTIAIGVKKRTSSSTSWNDAENPFYVRKDGYVVMTNANVTGTVNATAGNIGGCSISDGVLNVSAANITSGTINSAHIPNLSADKITVGTLNADRIPNISASKITSGTISTDRLSSSVITTGNFSSKSLSTGNLTVSGGSKLGYWTVTTAGGLTCGSGTSSVGLSSSGVSHGSGWTATWYDIIQAGNGASDKRLKHDISEFEDCYDNVFDNLKPVKFRYNIDPDRLRMGFIAQDVKEDFEAEGINDFGGVYVGEGEDDYYRLLKEDFIALNTWQIQKLKARVEELETKLAALET